MSSEPLIQSSDSVSASRQCGEPVRIFEELPKASIVSVSRPETGEISPILLSYTIELQYKQACKFVYIFVFLFFLKFSGKIESIAMVFVFSCVVQNEFQGILVPGNGKLYILLANSIFFFFLLVSKSWSRVVPSEIKFLVVNEVFFFFFFF